ncbi:hypothetical protein ACIG5E_11615 [Kitasatospora sp. NPDC053057]|uniref:hypothetical protein n=1 Tax=Kitasatospora sp. NPDC053057 TaxID=3364062 RepID=UPI0037C96938
MLTKKIATAAVAVAAAGVLATATSASAATTLYNTAATMVGGGLSHKCTSRTLDLAAGSYGWGFYSATPYVSSTIKLAAGSYTWTDCLTESVDYYYLDSSLQLNGSSSAPATLHASRWIAGGSYTYGSFLKPNF